MTNDKAARQLSLIWCLRNASRYLSREEIRDRVEQYRCLSDDTFARKFERDKKELRDAGIDIDTGSHDPWGEIGYRIVASGVDLPQITYTTEELTLVSVALRAWAHTGYSTTAGTKLGIDDAAPSYLAGYLSMPSEVLLPIVDALQDRYRVTFDYRGRRTVEPWGLVLRQGSWYLIGRDVDKQARRVFKLDRVEGTVRVTGHSDAYTIPDDADLTQITGDQTSSVQALLALRRGSHPVVARRAHSTLSWDDQPEWTTPLHDTHDLVAVEYGYLDGLAGEIAAEGADVLVVDPPQLRQAVIAILSGVVS